MKLETPPEIALYVWDYFFLANVPHEGDDKAWTTIERATQRILESEAYLRAPTPVDIQLRHARRVRNAARVATRNIALLAEPPEPYITDALARLQTFVDDLIAELTAEARELVLD